MKVTIRTVLNNIIHTPDEEWTYTEKFIWSKRHKDESVKGQQDDDHNSITNEPNDAMVRHSGDTSKKGN